MISVLITAFREADTIGPAIEQFLAQLPADGEILVVSPDPETIAVVDSYAEEHPDKVRHVADPQRGKPKALNVGLKAGEGEIVVLSDGDVLVEKNALGPLLEPFEDPNVGAVSGRPVTVNDRDNVLGYWSHLLTHGAHAIRLARHHQEKFLVCSGYLFAFRRDLIDEVPCDALAEDAVISHKIAQQGYAIRYAPEAVVQVKYPTTYRDWLRQKVRSAGGYAQKYVRESDVRMRSAWLEFVHGTRLALTYPQNLQEFAWSLLLFAARFHLWLLVLINVRILKRPLSKIWQRVESTK